MSQIKIQQMVDNIGTFSEDVHLEIFQMLKKYMTKDEFTVNSNGVFINMKILSDDVLLKLEKFVNFCKENNESLKKREKEYEEVRKNIVNNNVESEETHDITIDNTILDNSILNDTNLIDSVSLKNISDNKKNCKINDIELTGAYIPLHQNKNKFTGIQAKIIKDYKNNIDSKDTSVGSSVNIKKRKISTAKKKVKQILG